MPWSMIEERPGARTARRLGRGALWAVVALAAVTGVRAWITPDRAPAPTATPAPAAVAAYPVGEAQAVAARFARAYLTFDADHAEERAAVLAGVLPADADSSLGWDGHGSQRVLAVEPGTVTPAARQRARVRIDALVRAKDAPAGKGGKAETHPDSATAAAASSSRWIGLDVPVVLTAGRVVVTGPPGLVGIPTAGPAAPTAPAPQPDAELSEQTRDTVKAFLAAYAAGATESVTAPGATVAPLPRGVELAALSSWTVTVGTGADRSGTARVVWSMAGAALEQTYRIELTRVASADAARWQVTAVHGGS
ncbi:conjugal transfer protein [Streptomyces sp. NPDC089919]|uniref:conjugal transfer protein n=1 Tax=Streptomyces sp. NPDC089919 TaxID=3155188 RepID=UPI003435CFF9